jgi:HAD superfamily hydrolase (TIGR01549 family)
LSIADSQIRAVTFDLWETLLFEKNGANSRRSLLRCQSLTKTLNDLDIGVSIEKTNAAMDAVAVRLVSVWAENRDLSHRDQLTIFLNSATDGKTDLSEDLYGVLSEAYVSAIFDDPPHLNPDAREVLCELKKRQMGIGLICNSGITPGFALRRLLRNEGVLEFFDCMLFSDETGIRKPDPRMFRWAADQLRVNISQIAHVGDNLNTDVGGGKSAGSRAVYFASDAGRDKEAEADSKSLVMVSRNIGKMITSKQAKADWIVYSLMAILEGIV